METLILLLAVGVIGFVVFKIVKKDKKSVTNNSTPTNYGGGGTSQSDEPYNTYKK
jgi:hypothetical protein